jgi:hypothetical protein
MTVIAPAPNKTTGRGGRSLGKWLEKIIAGDSFDEKHFAEKRAEFAELFENAREVSRAADQLGAQIRFAQDQINCALVESRKFLRPK